VPSFLICSVASLSSFVCFEFKARSAAKLLRHPVQLPSFAYCNGATDMAAA
jgi:hypothetical protein